MPFTTVRTERGNNWAVVRLASPDGLNRLGTQTLERIHSELTFLVAGNCRCLALVGEGRSFAVGADLREIRGLDPVGARKFSDLGNRIFRLLENCRAVVVAGIDGFCLGGGLDLALSSDWRIATGRSIFGHPGAGLGFITGFGGTQRLPRIIGRHRAARWLFTGERVTSTDAYNDGFLQEICPHETFEEILMTRTRQFAAMPVRWITGVKQGFRYYGEGWPGPGCPVDGS